MTAAFVSPDAIRSLFSQAMSDMYRTEVPQYGTLLNLVADINQHTLAHNPALREALAQAGDMDRIDVERHGAIRLGTAHELATLSRLFRVMGMQPVSYYDLSVAGVPVHATAFRPVDDEALRINPFRVFTSLLRLELIDDPALREQARQILARRAIFTDEVLALLHQCERDGGLDADHAARFVAALLPTFRWHPTATVDAATYRQLLNAHRLVADVVCFRGPHINHLTPRTLDIDAAQAEMPRRGIEAKAVVEGPPRRRCPILLRQTSFKALQEVIAFPQASGTGTHADTHTARFGEIEQRGVALTRKGRALYDQLLAQVRNIDGAGSTAHDYAERLTAAFQAFPDDAPSLHAQGLAFYRYTVLDPAAFSRHAHAADDLDLPALLRANVVGLQPIVYEDFLPVSAAGIFQSNLGGQEARSYAAQSAQLAFEQALGRPVLDEFEIYAGMQQRSLQALQAQFAHGKTVAA
ncbi:DUF1338 domain-containing protein [Comamonas serinivorans]|uniref:2-oxoadipate dioxygenase/decarboxylase n=1 Tax=Comamonas serinivorans TaxID=1082851 RepID=A0A1Y0EKR1_9BURK|nr:VOC family protein [Comamonas serinivorans]ARU04030.1 DUF1338 domain-containing protein [Comamonas serinivorans]